MSLVVKMVSNSRLPIDESLHPVKHNDIYRNDEWWKSVVKYKIDQNRDYEETAVYLWHNEEEWMRKNKYVIKTLDAWETDKQLVDELFTKTSSSSPVTDEFPVSDYYHATTGETVFRSEDWWKAILKITQKGSYDTEEMMIYLWQEVNSNWRRRQKYTIKSRERWKDEIVTIESVLSGNDNSTQGGDMDSPTSEDDSSLQSDELKQLNTELDKHLSAISTK